MLRQPTAGHHRGVRRSCRSRGSRLTGRGHAPTIPQPRRRVDPIPLAEPRIRAGRTMARSVFHSVTVTSGANGQLRFSTGSRSSRAISNVEASSKSGDTRPEGARQRGPLADAHRRRGVVDPWMLRCILRANHQFAMRRMRDSRRCTLGHLSPYSPASLKAASISPCPK